ncbi:MAG: hypothetical protein FWG65_11415 [Turicibacter sp.]|nr:hypothetical protein [Turicibacter sp.]
MIIVSLLLLLAPGVISVRILWRNAAKPIAKEDYKLIVCDYFIYSFLAMLTAYAVMFFTYPERTVAFVALMPVTSHILSASFVFKYGISALVAAVVLPGIVPVLCRFWLSLEDGRKTQVKIKKKGK